MSQKTKRQRLQSALNATAPLYRAYSLQPRSVDETERTVKATITTETPVMEWDWNRGRMIPRILLTSGAVFPGQIPFLDSHNRYQMENQLGSARELAKEKGEVSGTLHFSSTADRQWTLVREGHASDVSAGFQVLSETYIEAGKTQRIQGTDYTGPLNVATKWRLYEVSLTPIGADEQAKLRGFDPNSTPQQDEEFVMLKEFKDLLLSRGMPADLEDDKAQEWAVQNADKLGARKAPEPNTETPPTLDANALFDQLDKAAIEREQKRIDARNAYRREIDAAYELADLDDIKERCYDEPDMVKVREKIKQIKADRAKDGVRPGGPRVTGDGVSAFRKDVMTCLTERMFEGSGIHEATRKAILPDDQRGKGWEKFRTATISELGRECLVMDGYRHEDVRWLSRADVATAIFASPEAVGLERRDAGPLHTTGSFAYLTENAMNKGLRAGYAETETTWQKVISKGEPVADFKPKRVYITSAVGNLTAWPDGEEPDLASFMDYKDSYGVEAYAKALEFSWQLFVNDDMGALTKAPVKLGNAAKRTVNTYAWSLVTANPTMADGQTFFLASPSGNRKKANYISSGLAVTVASLSALENLMTQQVGQNTREGNTAPDILNIVPKYLVVPSAQKNIAAAVVKSVADPNTSLNVGTHNPFSNALEIVVEPLLDANSTTAWYLVAAPELTDSVEVSFMQGHESPVMWSGMEEKTLTKWWAIRQVFGGKVIDHRGWAKQAGA